MTIEEAIDHCEEVARKKFNEGCTDKCYKCGEEHIQLAEWLKELMWYRCQNNTEGFGQHETNN